MLSAPEGVLLIDKVEGESSHAVVQGVKRMLEAKKVGHAGTLDPFATGLLMMLIGQGTKLFPYLTRLNKEYRATLRLGMETDTLDLTGRVVNTRPVPALNPAFIRKKVAELVGEIDQVPPVFSALKVKGRRAYELARKGLPVELKKRRVWIYRLDVDSIDLPEVTLTLECSKGTYVRSLASELGKRLGPGGHLSALRRLSIGPFTAEHAVAWRSGISAKALRERVIPLRCALPHLSEVEVDGETARKIRNGVPAGLWGEVVGPSLPPSLGGEVKVVEGNRLLAILEVRPPESGGIRVETLRVFN